MSDSDLLCARQGVSQTAWAFSKLGLPKHALFLAVAAAARPKLATYDPQVSTHGLLYSSFHVLIGRFAGTAGAGDAGVGVRKLRDRAWKADRRDLCAGAEITAEIIAQIIAETSRRAPRQARSRGGEFDGASASQLLWALTRLADGVHAPTVASLQRRLCHVAAGGLAPQHLLYALGAAAKLGDGCDAALIESLARGAAEAAAGLTANKLGIAAWALGRPSLAARIGARTAEAWGTALRRRCAEVADHIGWRTAGHVEMALRSLPISAGEVAISGGEISEDDPTLRVLNGAVARAVEVCAAFLMRQPPPRTLRACEPVLSISGNQRARGAPQRRAGRATRKCVPVVGESRR